jgi:SAM-dependent methyltransferase
MFSPLMPAAHSDRPARIDGVSKLWEHATEASARFASQAEHYDRHRPRYPAALFVTLLREADLVDGDVVVEIGAGTGLATEPLAKSGLDVHAVEPAAGLAVLAQHKLQGLVSFVHGRFEDCPLPPQARLVTAFNAWHWVEPRAGLDRAAELLTPRGSLALVWTEVQSWGPAPFEERLADIFGAPWPKIQPHIEESLEPVASDSRYGEIRVFHHPFGRVLDGASYVAVTQTYGGQRTPQEYEALERMIREEFDDAVVKREDAVAYICRVG